ncbi:unnamed protein product, partial [Allacma fusca]
MASLFVTPNRRSFAGDPAAQNSEVLWEYLHEQRKIKHEVLDKMKTQNLDVILTPAFPFPATKIEDAEKLLGGVCYTAICNFLDFPAGVTPFGTET